MNLMEIVLLVLGLAVFVISFLIPDKKNEVSDSVGISEDEIRQLVDDEYERTKARLTDLTDETISYSMEKAERQLEKISNEKLLALGEYSDTVLNQISTNHKETVFLHDMLNNNKNELTVLLSQAIKDSKEASDISVEAINKANQAIADSEKAYEKSKNSMDNSIVAEEKMISARKQIEGNGADIKAKPKSEDIEGQMSIMDYDIPMTSIETRETQEIVEQAPKKTRKRTTKKAGPELKFDSGVSADNNNEKILKLHKQGKSKVAIAKELGLGVGEVQLVIDLFK